MNIRDKLVDILPGVDDVIVSELSRPPKWIYQHGGFLIIVLFFLAVLLAYLIPYPRVLMGQVSIVTEQPPIFMNSEKGFTFEKIVVRDLDTLNKGDFIAFNKTDADLDEVLRLFKKINWVEENQFGNIELAGYRDLGEIQKSYERLYSNLEKHQARRLASSFQQAIQLKENRLQALDKQLTAAEDLLLTLKNKENLLHKNFQRYEALSKTATVSDETAEDKENTWLDAQRERKRQVEVIQALQIEKKQLADEVRLAQLRNDESTMQSFLDLSNSLRVLKADLHNWINMHAQVSASAGVIHFADYWVEGQQVEPNVPLFTILPVNQSEITAKVRLSRKGIGELDKGQTVWLSLDDYPAREYGKLKGRVEHVAPYARKDYHLVEVGISSSLITSYHYQIPFQQNLTGKAEVVILDRSLLETIFLSLMQIGSL